MDWTYSVLAENIEYLSEGDTFEESYAVHLSENFVNYMLDDVAQLDINPEIVGTNDQPEIVVEAVDDINVSFVKDKTTLRVVNYKFQKEM